MFIGLVGFEAWLKKLCYNALYYNQIEKPLQFMTRPLYPTDILSAYRLCLKAGILHYRFNIACAESASSYS